MPIKGEVIVKVGDTVGPNDVIARAMLPGHLQTIRLSELLGVGVQEAPEFLVVSLGDTIEAGQLIAETKGFIRGWFKQSVHSAYSGKVESISEVTGHVLVRQPSIPVEITGYIRGTVVEVTEGEGAVIETRCAMIQGIFGVGGERNGTIRVAVDAPEAVLDASRIKDSDAGAILVGGANVTADALSRATEAGVVGIVVGAVRDVDLIEFLGYDIGVAITGQEDISVTLMVTEGFGELQMAARTFKLFKSMEGKNASINGATQIRAGVIRPEVIVSIAGRAEAVAADQESHTLTVGTPIRIIREPYFGVLATVTDLPAQLQTIDSGARVRVLRASIDSGEEVTVPRANVEIISSS